MWTYGIQNPIMMKARLGIQSDMKRAYISEAVCREVMQQGCLHEAMWRGWLGGWDFWVKWGGVLLMQGQLVTSSVLYVASSIVPLYYLIRNTRGMIDMRSMLSDGHLVVQKALTGTSRKKKASPRTSLPDNASGARARTGSAPRSLPRCLSDSGASRVPFFHPASPPLRLSVSFLRSSFCSWHEEWCVVITQSLALVDSITCTRRVLSSRAVTRQAEEDDVPGY